MAKPDGYVFWCSKCKVDHAGECKTEPVTCPARHVFKAGIKLWKLDQSRPKFVVSDSVVPNGEAVLKEGVLFMCKELAAELGPTDAVVSIYGRKFPGWKYGE